MSQNKSNGNQQQTPADILKKLQQQSSLQKKQAVYKILQGQDKRPPQFSWWNIFKSKITANVKERKRELVKQARLSENKHLFIMTIFFTGAVWVSWKIQEKYDKMRSRARNTKSQKQRMVEEENKHINQMLAKNPFESVQIEQEEKEEQNYIFQKTQFEFNTKADLLQIMQKRKDDLLARVIMIKLKIVSFTTFLIIFTQTCLKFITSSKNSIK